jgi:hypothetical protein
MFTVFLSILVATVILGPCGEIVMRIRLTRREPSRDKLAWWRRGGDEVTAAYEKLFPHAFLPILRRIVFWLVVASAAALLLFIIWNKFTRGS